MLWTVFCLFPQAVKDESVNENANLTFINFQECHRHLIVIQYIFKSKILRKRWSRDTYGTIGLLKQEHAGLLS